jgi:spermidine/putrescine transport system substrate-binding protein
MPDNRDIERAIARAFNGGRYSRRTFLRRTGKGVIVAGSALSLQSILAACGINPSGGSASSAQASLPSEPAGVLNWANWPAYIDIDEETGDYPTIQKFQDETDIKVTYTESINDNEEFFGIVQPDLAAGNPPSYDLIVLTDWMIERMIRLGYLDALDKSKIPNFDANALDLYKDPWYDPGNAYSMAWQSGITGIGYNPDLTGREITTFDDLLDPAGSGCSSSSLYRCWSWHRSACRPARSAPATRSAGTSASIRRRSPQRLRSSCARSSMPSS